MPGLINIGATAPKEDAADKKAGSAPAGINRSRRRKSLRNIHYNANKSKTPGERTPRRGSAPAIGVPAPPVKAEESLAAADGEQEDALIGGGFGADDAVADSTADDLDGFGDEAVGASGGFGEAHLTDSENEGDNSDWDGNDEEHEAHAEDEDVDGRPDDLDDAEDEHEAEEHDAEDQNDGFADPESDVEEEGGDDDEVPVEDESAANNNGEQWDQEDADMAIGLATALQHRMQAGESGGTSFPGAAFHSSPEDYVPPATDDAYNPDESDGDDE